MSLLSRKGSRSAEPEIAAAAEIPAGAGKSTPTPRRSEARAARAVAAKTAATTRKERSQRARGVRAETMEALKQTDPAKLPKHERVPELVFARDQIDTRHNLAASLYVVMAAYFILSFAFGAINSSSAQLQQSVLFLALFWILGIAVDTFIATRTIETRVARRWPDSTVRLRGYLFRRAITIKRLRRPVIRPVPEQNRWDYKGS